MDDKHMELIERLRSAGADGDAMYCWNRCVEAADEIEHLTAKLAEARREIDTMRTKNLLTYGTTHPEMYKPVIESKGGV